MYINRRTARQNPSPSPFAPVLTLVQRARGQVTQAVEALSKIPSPTTWLSSFKVERAPETQAEKAQVSLQTHRRHAPAVAAVLLSVLLGASVGNATENRNPLSEPRPAITVVADVPAEVEAGPSHIVRRGESLWTIGKRLKVTESELRLLNPEIKQSGLIFPGQELKLPSRVKVPVKVSERGAIVPAPAVASGAAYGPIDELADRPTLRVRSRGPEVAMVEHRLADLGFSTGPADGIFDGKMRRAVRAFQMANELPVDGIVGPITWEKLAAADALGLAPYVPVEQARFRPGAADTITLFTEAARRIGVPEDWARSSALRNLLDSESDGWVGRPNYTYGARHRDHARWDEVHDELRRGRITADSSATGLGQLLLRNVDEYYPSGRAGIGDPLEEAIGMLAYIEDRYGSPQRAWHLYNRLHEGY
jgi:LysM repeat protein